MSEGEIRLHGYARKDKNGKMHYLVRSQPEDQMVNLKDVVIFCFPYETNDGRQKMNVVIRPADNQQKADDAE